MKIAVVHLSDFHIRDGENFVDSKVKGVLSALNILGAVDDYIVVFSGDLSFSGQVNEFKRARDLWSRLVSGIKEKNGGKFVNAFMVPGNHDLCLPNNARGRKEIQGHYDKSSIKELIPEEKSYLENFYNYSPTTKNKAEDVFLNEESVDCNGYKIEFKLINTALFSTLEPNDKEIHYFPDNEISKLNRDQNANLCITVMHHNYEWFHWSCKTNLQNAIMKNSEILLYGHDHHESTSTLLTEDNMGTWISSAGQMKFSSIEGNDSFNALVIDTETESFNGYIFTWNSEAQIYNHDIRASKKKIHKHTTRMSPLAEFVKEIKKDTYNVSEDFTKYFVFPQLISETKNKHEKEKVITSIEELKTLLLEKKKIEISGSTNAGKTTLLKYLYCSLAEDKIPLLLSVDSRSHLKVTNFIRHLFEDQYGDDRNSFEQYQQLDLDQKVLIIDDWDLVKGKQNKEAIAKKIEESFGYVIVSVGDLQVNVVDTIKGELENSAYYYKLRIKPFFAAKRNELVRNICMSKSSNSNEDINNVNRLIDNLVRNNSGLFSLNPAFIVRYTNYFIQDPYQDYSKGEAIFSKIFENEIIQSIMHFTEDQDADEIFTVFEEVAGYMFRTKHDSLSLSEVSDVVHDYNDTYGENVEAKDVVQIGISAKVFGITSEFFVYFLNKNYLSYFIAKYLVRIANDDPPEVDGVNYVLENICFGINADIVLFISYILNSSRIIKNITTHAGKLLEPWEALNFSEKNISLLHNAPQKQISPPSDEERKQYEQVKEQKEEANYSETAIEARGVFDYNDSEIDKYQYRLIRAIRYTELLCKALPTFHSSLKLPQKKELVKVIYLYPRKIVYALLRPLDMEIERECQEISSFIEKRGIKKENGNKYTEDDILQMFNDTARAIMLSMFDHFSELATSPKTYEFLKNYNESDISEKLEKLLIIENNGDTDQLVKMANSLLQECNGPEYEMMIKLVVRKHLLTHKQLSYNKKESVIDKIFGNSYRKYFLTK